MSDATHDIEDLKARLFELELRIRSEQTRTDVWKMIAERRQTEVKRLRDERDALYAELTLLRRRKP